MVLTSEPPQHAMSQKMSQKTKKGKNPVEVFNGSSSKLSKLPELVDYVSAALTRSDFIVVLRERRADRDESGSV